MAQVIFWGGFVDKRVGRYIVTALAIIAVVELCSLPIIYFMAGMPDYSQLIPRFERVEVKVVSVTKSTHTYFVIINFFNTGLTNTSIESLLLNGVPYDDSGWTGAVKPVVFGDITPETVLKVGSSYCTMVIFSDDCKDPRGKGLIVAVENGHYVNIGFHTTGGKDYDAFVILSWNCYPETSLCPASTLAIAIMVVIAFGAPFILGKRRARPSLVKSVEKTKHGRELTL